MAARKKTRKKAIDCDFAWRTLCKKDGVPCPGISDCRHVEAEIVPVIIKTGMKFVSRDRKFDTF
jgi:hypothetical protein